MPITPLLAFALIAMSSAQETCPAIPPNDVEIGQPVPIVPGDIPKGCSAFEILVETDVSNPARGTSEPSFPKFGVIVGDPVVSNVSAQLPGVQGYPVQYPASSQVITGGRQGTDDIVKRLTTQSAACPNQTFALVGYSQGASIMHRAAERLPVSLFPRIKAVVMFGDPQQRLGTLGDKFPIGLRPKVLQVCAKGDPVCDSGSCQYYHLTYVLPKLMEPAVAFIVRAFQGSPRL
ncbi:carbohydrate esterase family 5 protein [Bipolaris zeicola 26-R-13]|uniref:Carbohydrate esterase family 5 protein n=1 Tax=Cochliobolus carbonum (strain 26-R-13) TaxID=930089 RepID=W6YPA2_COCC2|nr:carbohydrate esterase family 5 protein [Bipolaris zeicola 26-R-13]EUC33236.1 carbohydrate esterase family 5 protein [Bipolaris zeicola 26-R-13]